MEKVEVELFEVAVGLAFPERVGAFGLQIVLQP
jgi:hypothetical protein